MCQKVLAKFPCLTIYIPFSLHRSQRTPYSHRLKYTHQATFLKKIKIKNHFLSHTEGLTALQNVSKDLYEPCHIAAHRQLQDRSQAQQPMRNSQERGFISALRFASLPYQGERFRAQMTLQIEPHPLRSKDAGKTALHTDSPPTASPRAQQPTQLHIPEPFRTKSSATCPQICTSVEINVEQRCAV